MRSWSKLGAVMTVLGLVAGCSTAPAPQAKTDKPVALARATSSALTKKVSGVSQWRIYQGRTHVVVLGFGKDKKPLNGLRVRYGSPSNAWAVSFEIVGGKGVLQLDGKGKIVRNTMTDEDTKMLFGASRIVDAWAKTGKASTTSAKSIAFADKGDCFRKGGEALGKCGKLVKKCFRVASKGSGIKGKIGAGLRCITTNAGEAGECGGSISDAGEKCVEAFGGGESKKEESKNPVPASESKDAKDATDATNQLTEGKEGKEAIEPPPEDDATEPGDPTEPTEPDDGSSLEPGAIGEGEDSPEELDPVGDSAEENAEEAAAAAEDPDGAPVDEEVADEGDESSSSEDDVDPDPQDEGSESGSDEPQEPEPETETESPAPSEEGPIEASLRLVNGLRPRAVSSARRDDGACGTSRVLVCGARKKANASFCRCEKL